ncbi:MAG TPA: glycosyl hydrolase family 28-related protein, partial [Candidatus Hydrogenedentes bacterium]|nr:glycosyl hydrolase family 28-related protein [Candidatus Hydrogenedentota bacterium]
NFGWLLGVWLAVMATASAEDGTAAGAPASGVPAVRNVMAYGVTLDGTRDCTAAFQQALNEVAALGGGTVEVPTGRYRFDGSLEIPSNVTLRGTFAYSPAHAGIRDVGQKEPPVFGSVLEPYGGAGSEEGAPFLLLRDNATVQGFTVHYPAQDPAAEKPTPYPWTVMMRGNNCALLDMQLLNPFNAIDARENQRVLIRNIHGQPIHIGIIVDKVYDIGRIENVHWNPWWSFRTPVYQWQMENGTAFIFGRTDWHYVLNTFCYGYHVGYHFTETKDGACNGNFLGIGADDCNTAVLIDQTAPMGLLITNGEFTSFNGDDPVMIRVSRHHSGTVRFVNCAFWGPCRRIADVDGTGTVGFGDCTFQEWSLAPKGSPDADREFPAIRALGGSLMVRGCEFMQKRPQLEIGPNAMRVLFSENFVLGNLNVQNRNKDGKVLIKDNLETPLGRRWESRYKTMPGLRGSRLRK